MKVLAVLALFCLVSFAAAQDLTAVLQCWEGRIENGTANMTEVYCNTTENVSCQTKIESNNGQVNIDRQCKQTMACQNNAGNNAMNCYSADAIAKDTRVCHYCCTTNLCNDFTDIPPASVAPATIDGEVPTTTVP